MKIFEILVRLLMGVVVGLVAVLANRLFDTWMPRVGMGSGGDDKRIERQEEHDFDSCSDRPRVVAAAALQTLVFAAMVV